MAVQTHRGECERDACDELAAALVHTALALGRAGRPTEALRLTAAGYAAVRREQPAAQRLNAAMHRLTRMPDILLPTGEQSAMPETIVDMRSEPPARRHALIFDTFTTLPAGGAFELVDDHDPKPLYYQLEAEQTGRFSWEYLGAGPRGVARADRPHDLTRSANGTLGQVAAGVAVPAFLHTPSGRIYSIALFFT